MRKTSIITFLVSSFLCSSIAVAGEMGHRQAAEKLLGVTGMEKALEQSIEQMLIVQLQQQPGLAPYREVMLQFFKKHMSFEILKEDLVGIYVEEFSEKELNDIIAFYETPTGCKTIEKLPVLMAKGAQLGASRVQKNIGELQEMIKAESERIRTLQEADKNK